YPHTCRKCQRAEPRQLMRLPVWTRLWKGPQSLPTTTTTLAGWIEQRLAALIVDLIMLTILASVVAATLHFIATGTLQLDWRVLWFTLGAGLLLGSIDFVGRLSPDSALLHKIQTLRPSEAYCPALDFGMLFVLSLLVAAIPTLGLEAAIQLWYWSR